MAVLLDSPGFVASTENGATATADSAPSPTRLHSRRKFLGLSIYNARNLHAVLVRRYVRSPREIPGRARLLDSASACSGSVVFDAHSRRERA